MATIQTNPTDFWQKANSANPGDLLLPVKGNYPPGRLTRGGFTIDGRNKADVIFGRFDGAVAADMAVRNLTIANVPSIGANLYSDHALAIGWRWAVSDVDVRDNGGVGVNIVGNGGRFTRLLVARCALGGGWTEADDLQFRDCGAIGNGLSAAGNDAIGGYKFYKCQDILIDGGEWAGNKFPAIWFDYQNKRYIVRNAYVHHNLANGQGWHAGIAVEISEGPGLIENNYVHDNTGDGIAIWESENVTVRHNTVLRDNIGWRDMTTRAPYRTRNNLVENNRIVDGQANPAPANANNIVRNNGPMVVLPGEPPVTPPAPEPTPPAWIDTDGSGAVFAVATFGGPMTCSTDARVVTEAMRVADAFIHTGAVKWKHSLLPGAVSARCVHRDAAGLWWVYVDAMARWRELDGDPRLLAPPTPADPQAEIAKLKAELDRANARTDDATRIATEANAEAAKLKVEVAQLKSSIAGLETDINVAQTNLADAKADLDAAEKALAQASSELEAMAADRDEMKLMWDQSAAAVRSLKARMVSIHDLTDVLP
jgi:parallel beta-helix repeat protein